MEDNARADVATSDASRIGVMRLFEAYATDVFGYAARRLGPTAGSDVTAEVFRVALARYDTFDPAMGSARGWLFGIASNVIRRHWRTEQRRLRAVGRLSGQREVLFDPLLRIEQRTDASRELDLIVDAVERLDPDDRTLLVLTAWEGLSHAEIADALKIPIGTVKSRLHRIRESLRQLREGVVLP